MFGSEYFTKGIKEWGSIIQTLKRKCHVKQCVRYRDILNRYLGIQSFQVQTSWWSFSSVSSHCFRLFWDGRRTSSVRRTKNSEGLTSPSPRGTPLHELRPSTPSQSFNCEVLAGSRLQPTLTHLFMGLKDSIYTQVVPEVTPTWCQPVLPLDG